MVTRRRGNRRRRPLQSLNERVWQSERRRHRRYQRTRQIDIAAEGAEILAETGGRLLPWRAWAASETGRRTGDDREPIASTDTGKMNVAKREYELASQRKQR
jgi:hypothetical protein